MKQTLLTINTEGRGIKNITEQVANVTKEHVIQTGLCHLFLQHTSASLILCENADPQVLRDLEAYMQRLVPDGDPIFKHTDEGPDDMPAHIRTILTQNSLSVPISQGQLALGTWQGIFLWEHRYQSHPRRLLITFFS